MLLMFLQVHFYAYALFNMIHTFIPRVLRGVFFQVNGLILKFFCDKSLLSSKYIWFGVWIQTNKSRSISNHTAELQSLLSIKIICMRFVISWLGAMLRGTDGHSIHIMDYIFTLFPSIIIKNRCIGNFQHFAIAQEVWQWAWTWTWTWTP